tara:strand:+ start:504 stop:698 length:195 start_codon:yes stop_codon:yes gene_type:complete
MKSKYRRYFKTSLHPKYDIEIKCNKTDYVFMYCNKDVKNFNKKAKRIYSHKLIDLIKQAGKALI